MTAGLGRTLTYTSYNMPAQVVGVGYSGGASTTYNYVYNAEHERTKLAHSTLGTFIYLHPAGKGQLLYEKQTEASPSTRIEHKYYISAGGTSVAVHYARENPNLTETTTATRYLHQDHLGSITLITNEAGGVTERLAYEAYGKRRYPAGTDDPTNGLFGQVTDRGFTSHEHLDEIALIHMNGRVYDPVLGRFVTADPFLQDPGNLQSYNRYSYVLNNPLMYVDPSGYFSLKKVFKAVAIAVVSYYTAGALMSGYTAAAGGTSVFGVSTVTAANTLGFAASAIGNGIAGGFAFGMGLSGGNFQAGLQGAISGGLFGAVGANFAAGTTGSYLGHAGVGCLSGAMSGGGCGRGAASAAFGKAATNFTDGWSVEARFVAATVAGGTASVIGGGKFENGATTAAFGYLFNACSQGRCWVTNEERALAQQGKFIEYWRAACDGGDSYACRAAEVSQGKGLWGRLATGRLTTYLINNGVIQSAAEAQPILDRIRADIVRADVGALDAAGAGNPVIRSREVINIYHENVFRQHGAPGAWGGRISDVFPGRGVYDYCPNCAR